jgi:hypothetical protein
LPAGSPLIRLPTPVCNGGDSQAGRAVRQGAG